MELSLYLTLVGPGHVQTGVVVDCGEESLVGDADPSGPVEKVGDPGVVKDSVHVSPADDYVHRAFHSCQAVRRGTHRLPSIPVGTVISMTQR